MNQVHILLLAPSSRNKSALQRRKTRSRRSSNTSRNKSDRNSRVDRSTRGHHYLHLQVLYKGGHQGWRIPANPAAPPSNIFFLQTFLPSNYKLRALVQGCVDISGISRRSYLRIHVRTLLSSVYSPYYLILKHNTIVSTYTLIQQVR